MVQVTFFPDQKTIRVHNGTTILQAARMAGVLIGSPCNGAGICGKCKVKLKQEFLGHIVSSGKHHLSQEEEAQGYVLSCETSVMGDVEVEVLQNRKDEALKILSMGQSFEIALNPFIRKEYDSVENTTRVFGGEMRLGVEAGDTRQKLYGIVVDIGTTTLVTALIDLNDGKEIAAASSLNPQAIHAQDVLSRIRFASDPGGLKIMYTSLIEEIGEMIGKVARNAGISKEYIYEVVLSGNTCMLHLATGINPGPLGKYPYISQIEGGISCRAADYGFGISEFGLIYLPPVISAYVGADITSGVLAAELHKKAGITLFVDIGTNGEMVIGQDGKLSATSTAAGPAFEGMNITFGMRAGEGAVEFFEIEEHGSVNIGVIGNTKAVGICGSGLLDIVGELVANGVINNSGKFADPDSGEIPPGLRDRLVKKDGKLVFKVTEEVCLSQKDVRQVQLAKGAVRAGIEFLLACKGVRASDVDNVLIAGSFGYHLRAKSLINLGLVPREFEGKISFIGNTSKSGGEAFLLNEGYRREMEDVAKKVEVLELANYKDFDKVFVRCLGF